MSETPLIILIDRDKLRAEETCNYLSQYGIHVDIINDPVQAKFHLIDSQPDAIILRVANHEIQLCQDLRAQTSSPILLMSKQLDVIDHVLALEIGADDYLCTSTISRLFLARVKALIRRAKNYSDTCNPPMLSQGCTQFDNLIIDNRRRCVIVEGKKVHLSTPEFDVLHCLAENAGHIISRQAIFDSACTRGQGGSRYIDIVVSKIRRKIHDVDRSEYIITVRGQGYMFIAEKKIGSAPMNRFSITESPSYKNLEQMSAMA
ncbi:MAG: response regulator transcription factor [Pseudomonadales bacterium]|nr:response regulator transcription factor [Pseudomonadales bacterium]